MSSYERQEYTKEMNVSRFVMIALFAVVMFCAFGVPALKDTYGVQLFTHSSSY